MQTRGHDNISTLPVSASWSISKYTVLADPFNALTLAASQMRTVAWMEFNSISRLKMELRLIIKEMVRSHSNIAMDRDVPFKKTKQFADCTQNVTNSESPAIKHLLNPTLM